MMRPSSRPISISGTTCPTLVTARFILPVPSLLCLAAPIGRSSPWRTDRNILLSSDRGAVLLESGEAPVIPAKEVFLPLIFTLNPFKPTEGDGQLKLAGIDADALNGDAADVRVFNLEGQPGYENEFVSEGVGFWDGKNISVERNPVTTGMYVVKITFRGQSVVKPLAILR